MSAEKHEVFFFFFFEDIKTIGQPIFFLEFQGPFDFELVLALHHHDMVDWMKPNRKDALTKTGSNSISVMMFPRVNARMRIFPEAKGRHTKSARIPRKSVKIAGFGEPSGSAKRSKT